MKTLFCAFLAATTDTSVALGSTGKMFAVCHCSFVSDDIVSLFVLITSLACEKSGHFRGGRHVFDLSSASCYRHPTMTARQLLWPFHCETTDRVLFTHIIHSLSSTLNFNVTSRMLPADRPRSATHLLQLQDMTVAASSVQKHVLHEARMTDTLTGHCTL